MDNACHTLCALALRRAGFAGGGARATAAVVIAANAPDVDIAVALWGGLPDYLVHHRGITHSVLGLAVLAVAIAAACRVWPRTRDTARPAWGPLLLAAGVGAASHLVLDGLNSYGIRPWLPFSARWLYLDVAFVVDPLLWLAFGAAAAVGGRPGRAGTIAWAAWTAVATAVLIAFAGSRLGWWVPATFGGGMGLALLLRGRATTGAAAAPTGNGSARGARLWIVLAAGYLALLTALGQRAEATAREALRAAGSAPTSVVATCRIPRPGDPFAFEVLLASEDAVHPVAVDLLAGRADVGAPLPRNLDEPLLQRVRLGRELRAWRAFARLPMVRRTDDGALRLGDARFRALGQDDWSALTVEPVR